MDIGQLETFLAVAEEKSFSRAAQRLKKTQPAISQSIRRLEEELEEALFERTSRDGSLTAAGEVLRGYAERMIRLRAEAANAMEELKELDRGHLRLAANEYTCLYLLPVLDEFRRRYPEVDVTVHRSLASQITDELTQRTVELGVISFSPPQEHYRSIVVYGDELVLIAPPSHTLARRGRPTTVAELGREVFIAHNVPSPMRRLVIETFARHKTPLNMSVQLPSIEAIKRFVAMGNGVALVPALTVARELEAGELITIPVQELAFSRSLRLIYRRAGTLSHTAAAMLEIVQMLALRRGAPFLFQLEDGETVPDTEAQGPHSDSNLL